MFIIAEIGQAHDGSLGLAHSYIDVISKTGVDAIKFQTHIAEAESSVFEPFRVNFSYEDKTRYDYWERMEFTFDEWQGLKKHCLDVGVEFISSPFSIAAVDLLEKVGVDKYKIGSGEINNTLLLKRISKTGKPVILSSGISTLVELDESIRLLEDDNIEVSLLQCTTAYPTNPSQWGLNIIREFKERYKVPVGFSDHSGDIYACLAATTLGAEIIEFHAVFDNRMFGPDAKASLTIDKIALLVRGVKDIEKALSYRVDKSDNSEFINLKNMFEKSLAINRDLKAGTIIREEMLEAKKPKGQGIDASDFMRFLGKPIRLDKKQWGFLNEHDFD